MRVLVFVSALALAFGVPAAFAWPGRPISSPPPLPGPGAPPPAWIESQTKSAWLAYGSYCWKTACVDMIPPQSRPGLPTFRVVRGKLLRVHLGFVAKSATVSVGKTDAHGKLDATKRIVSWTARSGGIVNVSVRAAGDASYVAHLRLS